MPKIDYSQAEKGFDRAVKAWHLRKLLQETGWETSSVDSSKPDPSLPVRRQVLFRLKKDLEHLSRAGEDFFASAELNKEQMEEYLRYPTRMSEEYYGKIKRVKEALLRLYTAYEDGSLMFDDVNESIIFLERREHLDRRHNVRRGWKPV
ncbi:MAG: hypothetical protein CMO81_05910 [Waddliaceae bacterium]|nr:hypothetical protein [Waddliaceae bacterium]